MAIIAGMVAYHRGHEFWPWFIYSLALPIWAHIHAITKRENQSRILLRQVRLGAKNCPRCGGLVCMPHCAHHYSFKH
ncbi:hypothetical protein KSF73_07900 [Burkholderiaceae bacterium DAT-1]|nr:hypothetical protein [Burkholderiaceae bacterium DAT-1]